MDSIAETISPAALHGRLFKLYQQAVQGDPEARQQVREALDALADQAAVADVTDHEALVQRYRRLIELSARTPQPATPAEVISAPQDLPLVLTSINPFGRGQLQLRCFLKWLELGFDAYTCNHGVEMEALIKLGVPQDRIMQLGDNETGKSLYGKPVPKIRSVLARAEAMFDKDLLLVNSDLYPATDNTGFLSAWRETGEVLALTREEVLSLDHTVSRICHPYRGGLDAFLLPRAGLVGLLKELALFPVSNRMCFGIVGWDYFVGAVLERRLDATFADSRVLFHEMHQPTYSNVAEFSHYLTSMQALGIGLGKDHVHTAMEFADMIEDHCARNRPSRRPPELVPTRVEGESALSDEQVLLLEELTSQMPELIYALGHSHVVSLIGGISARIDVSFSGIISRIPETEHKRSFAQTMLVFILMLRLRWQGGATLTEAYPKGNMHAAAVRIIRDNSKGNSDLLRSEVAKLFCIEAADYKIFNPRLFNVMALSCENDAERALVSEIRNFMSGKIEHAA